MAYARIIDAHTAEAGTAASRIVYRGAGDVAGQRHPSGLTEESRALGRPLVDPGGTGCHLRFVGYLEGLLCHGYYPYTVEPLEVDGPVAGFRASMRSDHAGWHHFYDVSCDYLVFEELPEAVLIRVRPRLRKGSPAAELPYVRLNHIGKGLKEGGMHVYSYDPDGPYHRDQTTGEAAEAYNRRDLPPGDPARGTFFAGALNPRGSDLVPTLTRGIITYRESEGRADTDERKGWLFRLRDFLGTYLTPGGYHCLDLDGSRAVHGDDGLFALWYQTDAAGWHRMLDLERGLNTPLPVTVELAVDGEPARVVATNQWHRPKKLAILVLPPALAAAIPATGVPGSARAGVLLLRDLAPYERREVGSLEVRARYRSDREIELDNATPAAAPLTLVLREDYAYDGRTFDPDQFLSLGAADGEPVPCRVHLHRARILVPPGRTVLEHRNGSFASYRHG